MLDLRSVHRIDLRTKVVVDKRKKMKMKTAIRVKPNDSKESDFHLALADYLYKELKHEGIKVKKKNVILSVYLENLLDDKYEKIIIDCLDGKMYLKGKQVKDKYFGKLREFEGTRRSEAYECVVQSAKRIVNRIKKLQKDTNHKKIVIEAIDLRSVKECNSKVSFLNSIKQKMKEAIYTVNRIALNLIFE